MLRFLLFFVGLLAASTAISQSVASSEQLLVEFDEYSQMIRDRDRTPRLRVFDSGRVEVYYPAYMKRAGRYTLTLPAVELEQLIASLSAKGMLQLSSLELAEQVEHARLAEAQSGEWFHVSDDTVTRLEIRRTAKEQPNVIVWDNLTIDARRYAGIAEIDNLATAVRQLHQLSKRADLVRIGSPMVKSAER